VPARVVYLPENRVGDWETVDRPWLLEPDAAAATELLRRVVANPREAAEGRLAALVREQLTWEHATDTVERRLRGCPSASRDSATGRVRVSLCMIVRDEERNLPDCLRSVADLVDEIIIVDTGSSDRIRRSRRRSAQRVRLRVGGRLRRGAQRVAAAHDRRLGLLDGRRRPHGRRQPAEVASPVQPAEGRKHRLCDGVPVRAGRPDANRDGGDARAAVPQPAGDEVALPGPRADPAGGCGPAAATCSSPTWSFVTSATWTRRCGGGWTRSAHLAKGCGGGAGRPVRTVQPGLFASGTGRTGRAAAVAARCLERSHPSDSIVQVYAMLARVTGTWANLRTPSKACARGGNTTPTMRRSCSASRWRQVRDRPGGACLERLLAGRSTALSQRRSRAARHRATQPGRAAVRRGTMGRRSVRRRPGGGADFVPAWLRLAEV
jgi:hypothetical protein